MRMNIHIFSEEWLVVACFFRPGRNWDAYNPIRVTSKMKWENVEGRFARTIP